MAATKARTRPPARNNGAGGVVPQAAREATKPAMAAGAAAAGLAGGLLIGSRLGAGSGLLAHKRSRKTLALTGAQRVAKTVVKASRTVDDIHAIREHLEDASKRSPIEVVLDGLTHRRGTRRRLGK
jgi:hypothetical protein